MYQRGVKALMEAGAILYRDRSIGEHRFKGGLQDTSETQVFARALNLYFLNGATVTREVTAVRKYPWKIRVNLN